MHGLGASLTPDGDKSVVVVVVVVVLLLLSSPHGKAGSAGKQGAGAHQCYLTSPGDFAEALHLHKCSPL